MTTELFTDCATMLAGLAGALLGWRPEEFWAATPAELAMVVAVFAGDDDVSVGVGDLARLMQRFPDHSPSSRT